MNCERCIELEQALTDLERTLRAKSAEVTRLRNRQEPKFDPEMEAKVQAAFGHWHQKCRKSHPNVKLTPKRAARVRARLRDGYDIRFILRAIDGAAAQPTTVNGVIYDDIELICRDGEHLEDHERRHRGGGGDITSKLVGA